MLNTLAYLLLLAAFLHAVFFGSRRLLYAAAFFMPMTQVMPNPAGPPSVPINLIMGGLLLALIFHKAKIKPVSGSLPLKGPILFLWSMFLASFAGRTLDEFSGSYYLIPFGAAFRILWYWMAGFLVYVLAYRWIEGKRTVRRIVFLCQASFVGEALLTVIERLSDPGRATAHLEEVNRAGAYFASAGSFFLVWFFLESGGLEAANVVVWSLAAVDSRRIQHPFPGGRCCPWRSPASWWFWWLSSIPGDRWALRFSSRASLSWA